MIEPSFPALLQRFFSGRRCAQLVASLHTVASSRDTFRLFLVFAAARLGRPPSRLCIEQLDALLVGVLLDHLERDRGNSARTCNSRLSALRAFFRYVAFSELARALQCLRSLATPSKRHQRRDVTFYDAGSGGLADHVLHVLQGAEGDLELDRSRRARRVAAERGPLPGRARRDFAPGSAAAGPRA